MENIILEVEKANKCLKVADHMLNITYPMVKDPKILVNVLDNLNSGIYASISALLFLEEYNRNIPSFQDNFESRFFVFKMNCVDRFKINHKYLPFITDLRAMLEAHKKSPVEFIRKDKYVMCSHDYEITELNKKVLYDALLKAKVFIDEINNIIYKDSLLKGKANNGLHV
jgi:hypothetical protein